MGFCLTAATAVALALSIAVPALAQDYPSKPIKIVVPVAPGGIADIVARTYAGKLSETGHTAIVENRAGGAGVIASEQVAKSPADGYTLMLGHHGVLSVLQHLTKLNYDPARDFVPVVHFVTVPNILVVHPSVPARDLKELIAYAKANPGKLSYASQGVGATGHIASELFKQAAGIEITHVPYKGAAPAAQDLVAGHVSMMFDVVSLALGSIKGGQVRAIGLAAPQRVSVLPDLPTLAEQGLSVNINAYFGLVAPAGTPSPVIAWLNREANKVFAAPESRERFTAQGAFMPLGTADAFGKFIDTETKQYGEVIRRASIRME